MMLKVLSSLHKQTKEQGDDEDKLDVVEFDEDDDNYESFPTKPLMMTNDSRGMKRMEIGYNDVDNALFPFQPSAGKGACICMLMCSLLVGIPIIYYIFVLSRNLPHYLCPSDLDYFELSDNYNEDRFHEYEIGNVAFGKGGDDNVTAFFETFRHEEYDDWGKTFVEMKELLREFKEKYFVPNVHPGDTIYESAMGIGLNLLLSMELLEESKPGITSTLTLYGNEFLPRSTGRANLLFDSLGTATTTTAAGAHKGIFCSADSTKLHDFVPADTFDVVYTGYIQPIVDPLHLNKPSYGENYDYYDSWCDVVASDVQDDITDLKALVRIQQELQEDFFCRWVEEMIRIAKPGAPILIESISLPTCENEDDWGGVNKQFWINKVASEWKDVIDSDSLEFAPDKAFQNRYHAFMRKRQEKS